MPRRFQSQLLIRLLTLVAALSAVQSWGCSVPVFRYALERWPADPYQAVVFHRGPLTEIEQAIARCFSADGLVGGLRANISLRTVDLDQNPRPELVEVWQQSGAPALPAVVVQYPLATRLPGFVWSGPLASANAIPLLYSPARKELVQRLVQGDSAVWVLLESGNAQRDNAAADLLAARLAFLSATLKLPKLDAEDIAKGFVPLPDGELRVEFSMLRLSRSDAAEAALTRMLLGTETDLADVKEPIVFPVFGRGRALYALVGAGIRTETIDRAAIFLIGKCSCEVKEKNPGVDLLLAADWEKLVKAYSAPARDLPALTNLPNLGPVTVTISGTDAGTAPADNTAGSVSVIGILPVAGGLGAAAILAAFILMRRRKG